MHVVAAVYSSGCYSLLPSPPLPIYIYTVAEGEYQAFLYKKQLLQFSYDNEQAELDGLIVEMEKYTALLDTILTAEIEAKELVNSLPQEILKLEAKLSNITETERLFSVVREVWQMELYVRVCVRAWHVRQLLEIIIIVNSFLCTHVMNEQM